jgi:hypothetical protein
VDRIAAARERVQSVKAELHSPAVHLPCIKCRYYELVCTHPAVIEVRANPETGKVKAANVDVAKARAEDGACGPEGALFDARSPLGLTAVSLLSTPLGRWFAIVGVIFMISKALGY